MLLTGRSDVTVGMNAVKSEYDGEVLLIDKPFDWTSFDVVKRIRWSFNIAKVGHTGTLDPQATGLLIVCTGKKTKEIDRFVGLDKEYAGTFELGVRTPSFDSETDVIEQRSYEGVTLVRLQEEVQGLIGKIFQLPPMYSAVKYRGKPLYKYARRGKVVTRDPKEIEIMEFEITGFRLPFIDFRVVCSKGTYIRSLVDDLGQKLGCGATLRSLRRTRIGSYHIRDAMTIEQMENSRTAKAPKHSPVAHEGHLLA